LGAAAAARRVRRLAAVGAVLVALATIGVTSFLALKAARLEKQMKALARPAAAAATPASAEAVAAAWTVDFEGTPAEYEVLVDGILHPERPVTVVEAPGARRVEVRSQGYEPWKSDVAIHSDVTVRVEMLEPSPPAAPAEHGKAAKPSASKDEASGDGSGPGAARKKSKKKIDVDYPGL
jgi:hypothetical protein